MDKWHKFRSLSWPDRLVLLRAMISLPLIAVALRCLGVGRTQAILNRLAPFRCLPDTETIVNVEIANGVARLVRIAATRGLYSANCLERSLVLWWFLRSRGLCTEIRYGAHNGDRGFEAHAWVEYANHVIGDRLDIRQQFAPFSRPFRSAPAHQEI